MNTENIKNDLSHIRQMMERSSRFISLSGLSGVFAGISALMGCVVMYVLLQRNNLTYREIIIEGDVPLIWNQMFLIAMVVLVFAVFSAYYFTANKSRKLNLPIWDLTTKKLLANFSIPLVIGGLVCLAFIYHHQFIFIAPITLIFYGIALIIAEKYTLTDVKYLGLLDAALGIFGLFVPEWGLELWGIGFGILHLFYGFIMYKKYK